jgi:oligopeptidase B
MARLYLDDVADNATPVTSDISARPNFQIPASAAEPRAEKHPITSTWHSVAVTDEFAWLKALNWQAVMRDPSMLDPKIRAYLDAENAYAATGLADTEALQAVLLAEMKGRIKEDDSSVPSPDGPYAYFTHYAEGGQHPQVCREPRGGGPDQLLLDGDALAKDKPFFHFGEARHSPDHRLLAWISDDAGSEFYTARIRDIATGVDLPDSVPEVAGSVVWTKDTSAFYYVRLDELHRPLRVFRHRVGTPSAGDVLIFESAEPQYFVALAELQSGRYAQISVHDHDTAECWLIDLADVDATPTLIAPRQDKVYYEAEHHPAFRDAPALIIRTDADKAEDFKIVWTPLATPGPAHWRDLVPHRPGVYILAFAVFADWLIRLEREDGLPRIVVRALASGEEHSISFAEEAYSLATSAGYEFETRTLRFTYSSMTTPSEVWDYDLVTRSRVLRKRQEIPSGHDPSAYVTRRLQARAPDGELVPISVLHRKDTLLDGTAPGLVYGYGAYGISIPASFSTSRLSLVDRGFVYAIAHVRGGSDKGRRWYRGGKLGKKPNTFRDFIAVTEYLIAQRFMSKSKVVADGGSAGGMLMGAITNIRPDLYTGIIAEVPFVDVLNTMLDEELPLTPPEWPEWGNPRIDPLAFKTIQSYSPYDNVSVQDYPAMLVLAGLTDPRVTYWEPAKWVARLRDRRTNRTLLALRTNMDAGHMGAPGRFDKLKEVALAYAFAVKVTGDSVPQ